MRRVSYYVMSFLLLGSSLMGVGCSKEEVTNGEIDSRGEQYISLTLSTPVSDKVVFPKSRVETGTPIQEKPEWEIKSLNLYMFQKGDGSGDAAYTLYYKEEGIGFEPGEQLVSGNTGTDTGSGVYTFIKPISDDMIGKTFKFVLVANDKSASVADNVTLETFKQAQATAYLKGDDESADNLVGGAGEGATGFPMTDIAEDAKTGSEDVTIGYSNVAIKAHMLRNVARIDFFNYTPNMVIKGAKLLGVASHSYLFGKDGGTDKEFNPYEGEGLQKYSLNPTAEWMGKFSEGISYVPVTQNPLKDDESASRNLNTLKHVFYLYEQTNTEGDCAKVQIDYTLTGLTGGVSLDKQLVIELKTTGEGAKFINPTRNFLYTIKLGDGTEVDNEIKVASVVVDDWLSGGNIDEEINPDDDLIIIPNPSK